MARSLLGAFVGGTRQMLAVQLFVSLGAVGLAGWTLSVTNELIRERDRLQERVIELEETLAENDIVVPSTTAVVEAEPAPTTDGPYPPSAPPEPTTTDQGASTTIEEERRPTDNPTPVEPTNPPVTTPERSFDPGRILSELLRPAPTMRTVVIHARSDSDAAMAQRFGAELARSNNVGVTVLTMPPRDPRESGYAYFDGRQSRAAAELVGQFNEIARRSGVAAWSAQMRGVALPAQGEYTAERLDIVLPPLPAPTPERTFDRRFIERDSQIVQPQPRIN